MIRKSIVVLDTPNGEHIHLFSVIEDIRYDMQDAGKRDRHTYAHHYKPSTGLGDIQIHIEHVEDVNLHDMELNIDRCLAAGGDKLLRLNKNYVREPAGEGQSMYLDAASESVSTIKRVLPRRLGTRMVRAYLDAERETLNFVKQDDKIVRHLSEITKNVFGFDLTCYSEHIGNIYFVETMSPIKEIDVTGLTNPKGLLCAIEYRDSNWQEDFVIQVRDRHHRDVIVWDHVYPIKGGTRLVILELPQEAKEVEIYVYDNQHQLLYNHPYTPFLRSISVNLGVQSKVLRVNGKNENGESNYNEYPKFSHESSPILIGKDNVYVDSNFMEAKPLFINALGDEGLEFRFFDAESDHQKESVAKARKVLQDIINLATTECYICDPYFNASDFQNFIYPIQSLSVNVKILNGREQMRKKHESDTMERDRIMELKNVLSEYNEKMNGQPVQCKMLLGRGQLHDRLILTDDRGWVLGASFSEFGNRVTTINQIPAKYLDGIKGRIRNWWYDDSATTNIMNYGNNIDPRNDTSSK